MLRRADARLGDACQVQNVDDLLDARVLLAQRDAGRQATPRGVAQTLSHSQVLEECVVLEHEANDARAEATSQFLKTTTTTKQDQRVRSDIGSKPHDGVQRQRTGWLPTLTQHVESDSTIEPSIGRCTRPERKPSSVLFPAPNTHARTHSKPHAQ